MPNAEGESDRIPLRPCCDRRLKLEFHGSRVTSDAGLLAYRELGDALGLTPLAGDVLADSRTGKNGWHGVVGLLRQSVYGRLAGYEDVNDAERLGRDPAMRWIVGGKAVERGGASTSQMGRFETGLLATDENLAALADLSGVWIDRVHAGKLPRMIVLDMDSSVSPTHGDQEATAYNGHFGCTCYHPLFVFNQFGDLERCGLCPGNVHSAHENLALADLSGVWIDRVHARKLPGMIVLDMDSSARCVGTGGRSLPQQDTPALLPWRRRLRLTRSLRVSRSRGLQLRHPAPRKQGAARQHRPSAETPRRQAAQ